MDFEIYCDESHPDVFFSKSPNRAKFLMIGSLWIPSELRTELKGKLKSLKQSYNFKPEIKWHKIHEAYESFYNELIDLFLYYDENQLRFRCIAVEADKVDLVRFHQSDGELGFYKFYYQMLHHWIEPYNSYRIYCDEKSNRVGNRYRTLRDTLDNSNLAASVKMVQALPSSDVLLLQWADFLLGLASSRMNESLSPGKIKERLVIKMETALNRPLASTNKSEKKFNIFKINLLGGW